MGTDRQLIRIQQNALRPVDERAVADWDTMIDAFLDTLDSTNTRKTYARTLRRLEQELGGHGPGDVAARDLAAWRRGLLDQLEAGETAPATVRRKLMSVRSFFRFAHILGQTNIGKDVRSFVLKAPNGDVQKPFVVLDECEERRLLDALEGDERKMMAVMLYAGLRVTELCQLRGDDYYANGQGRFWLRIRQGKGKKARSVPVGPTLAAVLGEPGDGDGPMFASRQTKRDGTRHYTRVRLWQILRAALDRAWPDKRKPISPHSLRHTAAMRWLRGGVPLTVIREWLGHASMETTRRYLAHLEESETHALMK